MRSSLILIALLLPKTSFSFPFPSELFDAMDKAERERMERQMGRKMMLSCTALIKELSAFHMYRGDASLHREWIKTMLGQGAFGRCGTIAAKSEAEYLLIAKDFWPKGLRRYLRVDQYKAAH